MSLHTSCNKGCNNQFYVEELMTDKLQVNIEKVFFICPHCQQEYVAFYTDLETRRLQEKMRKLHQLFNNPTKDIKMLEKQETKLKNQIKASMDKVRKRIEE